MHVFYITDYMETDRMRWRDLFQLRRAGWVSPARRMPELGATTSLTHHCIRLRRKAVAVAVEDGMPHRLGGAAPPHAKLTPLQPRGKQPLVRSIACRPTRA